MANGQPYQNYFAPEIHSPLIIDESNTFDLTMSTSVNYDGKVPMRTEGAIVNPNGPSRHAGTGLIIAEPPKPSDLQVSPQIVTYAPYLLALFRTFHARRSCEPRMVWEND